ncbi:MAG: hypothetical protein Q9181_001050 [Wetmoreana brouardii]
MWSRFSSPKGPNQPTSSQRSGPAISGEKESIQYVSELRHQDMLPRQLLDEFNKINREHPVAVMTKTICENKLTAAERMAHQQRLEYLEHLWESDVDTYRKRKAEFHCARKFKAFRDSMAAVRRYYGEQPDDFAKQMAKDAEQVAEYAEQLAEDTKKAAIDAQQRAEDAEWIVVDGTEEDFIVLRDPSKQAEPPKSTEPAKPTKPTKPMLSSSEVHREKQKRQDNGMGNPAAAERASSGNQSDDKAVNSEKAKGIEIKATVPIKVAATKNRPLGITAEEVRALIPREGISIRELSNRFTGRIAKDQWADLGKLVRAVSRYD